MTTISGDTGVDKVDSSAIISASSIMTALNASGTAPIYACRAWVNFDGTLASASMIRASGNVSSIIDNGVGDYTINFTTLMPDANYSCSHNAVVVNNYGGENICNTFATGSLRFFHKEGDGSVSYDSPLINIQVFR